MEIAKYLNIFIMSVTIIYVVISLVVNAIERGEANSNDDIKFSERYSISTSSAIENILQDPVIDVTVLNNVLNEECPEGTVSKVYEWTTSETYCQCPSEVYRRSCGKMPSCKSISRKTFKMSIWKNKKVCLERLKNSDWAFATADGGSGCPSNFRRCPGAICVKQSISRCPINDLIVSKSIPSTPSVTYKNISFFTGENSIFISRDASKSPLVSLEAEITSAPCINTMLSPKRSDGKTYPIIVKINKFFKLTPIRYYIKK